ncbi:COG4315 family predicted lipoprotein [Sphaerisporangium perillae]|uniref:COG4315 family predicted lipoprotein n=1 Tax=Sphaerisporangium perillae TaxID=2935860 RepID=UPI00200DB8E9|nr:hypothetical protein [Sphaerisporangium perillae]
MKRILASSVGLATTALLVSACGGAGEPATSYSRAAANATESPSMETSPYPEMSPTATSTATSTSTSSPGASPSGTGSMSPMPTPQNAMVKLAESKYGKILVGENGHTLYMFDKDKDDTPSCYDACAVAWPPLLTLSKPKAGPGVMENLLGTATRKQGEKQVTYNKHPLYYYSGDKNPGEYNGQGKSESGGKWYVVGPDGKKVEK